MFFGRVTCLFNFAGVVGLRWVKPVGRRTPPTRLYRTSPVPAGQHPTYTPRFDQYR